MFTRYTPIEKYADEVIDQAINFAGVLDDGESVSSGEVKILDLESTDVTSTLCPGGASTSGDSVTYRLVAAGTPGMTYHVYALATLDTGEVLGECMRMFIPTP